MPQLSDFTQCGFLQFGSAPSKHELVYRSMISSVDGDTGQSYDVTPGTHEEASIYCDAQAVADTSCLLEHAANQYDPALCYEMLAAREADYRIVPPPNASIQQRRDALVARSKLNRGGRRENVVDQLTQALGADFLAYRVVKESESVLWPTTPGTGPGIYTRTDLPPRLFRLIGGTVPSGLVSYQNFDTSLPAITIQVGDVLCVGADDLENAEKVAVLATSTTVLGVKQFTAVFTIGHPPGSVVTAGPFPAQFSTRRFAFIVVSDAASIDPVRRAKVNAIMGRVARGVSQWGIVKKATATTIGPFVIGTSPIGAVPIAALTL